MEINLSTLKIGDKFKRRDGHIATVTNIDRSLLPVETNNGYWHRQDGSCCTDDRDYDLIERVGNSDALSPEVGKQYKTEDGRIATVTGLEYESGKFTGNFVGHVKNYGTEIWDKDGVPTQGSKVTALVALHVEPVVKTLFINCDADGCRSTYDAREEADEEASHDREACVEVTYTVGQGLEGEAR